MDRPSVADYVKALGLNAGELAVLVVETKATEALAVVRGGPQEMIEYLTAAHWEDPDALFRKLDALYDRRIRTRRRE